MTYHYIPHGLSVGDAHIPPMGPRPEETFQVYNRTSATRAEGDLVLLDLYGAQSEVTVFDKWNIDGTSAWGSATLVASANLQRKLPLLVVVEGGADNALITVKHAQGRTERVGVSTSNQSTASSASAGDTVVLSTTHNYADIIAASGTQEIGILLEDVSGLTTDNTVLAPVMVLYPSYTRLVP